MREHLSAKGVTDDDIDDLFGRMDDLDGMPANAREGGMGGRLAKLESRDRKRQAHDRQRRRQMAADAAADQAYNRASESFEKMFPGAARIRTNSM